MNQIENELTILIPCLNEEKTLKICLEKAKKVIQEHALKAEVLVIDNGSTDHSIEIATEMKVKVVIATARGYGNAIQEGNRSAKGKYIIMADADDSYNFLEIMPILEKLREGYDLVIGNRYKGKIEKGAMKWAHRYLGTPIISSMAKLRYRIHEIHDFNCGLRGYERQAILKLNCKAKGMEYASEMIIKAKQNNLKMVEIPIHFYADKREGKSHLRTIRDGIRHVNIILFGSH